MTPPSTRQPRRDFFLVVCAALFLCAFLKVPTLNYAHDETDELIYWQLATNLANDGPYSLAGSPLLNVLSRDVYDHTLFHHPPLFPALLVPFVWMGDKSHAIVVSWLGHMLAVIAVAMVGWHALRRAGSDRLVTSPSFWLPVLGVATDPVLQFISRKLWIDSLLAGLVAISLACLFIARGSQRRHLLLALSGLALGLAGLAKVSALLVLPIHVGAIFRREATWRGRLQSWLALGLPVALFVVPWCLLFYARCGVFLPPWVRPDPWLISHYAFLQAAVDRPWYYYLLKFPLLVPLVLVCLWQVVRDQRVMADPRIRLAAAWFIIVLAAITLTGIDGYGFQMRHVAPAAPAVYVIAILLLLQKDRPVMLLTSGVAIFAATVTGALYLLASGVSEIASLPEIARLIRL
jgi:4-amino-4-deoxy-L-arabinose transferase-like glycosyltransferase